MKKLTKTQWITFGVTVLGMLLGFVIDNAGLFGIGSKLTAVIGFLKIVYDLYISYSKTDLENYGEYVLNKSLDSSHQISVNNWKDAN